MEYVTAGLEPADVLRWFERISAVPRGSYNEAGIADFLVAFARERGLECYRDAADNVLIQAPATPGMENRPPLLLQGHTDMVCEKNRDVEHDFLRDPLSLYVQGGFLRARGTTLGADDGIAVAMMLALLDGGIPRRPACECLFTTAEEVGLDGAHAFDYSRISARRLINMDSEELGVVTAGCAGGLRSDLTLQYRPEPFAGECLHVQLKGLMGGHSGENINSGRANANKLMGRLLAALEPEAELHLARMEGGSKDNAIPRECEAWLAVPDAAAAAELLTGEAARIAQELGADDRRFELICEDCEPQACMMSAEDTRRAVALLSCAANGVLEMSRDVPGLVEYSRSLGVVRSGEGEMTFVFSTRSAMEARLDASARELDLLAGLCGCTARHHSRYPGWSYAAASPLRDAYLAAYRRVTGSDARVNVIHAGLECGVIGSHLPGIDMISVGPTMHNIHSPDEALDLGSVAVFWRVLGDLLPRL